MHEARFRTHVLGEMRQERDDVMLRHRLDLVDARHVERRGGTLFPDDLGGLLGDDPEFGAGRCRMRLDLEPDPEARFGAPDVCHLGA